MHAILKGWKIPYTNNRNIIRQRLGKLDFLLTVLPLKGKSLNSLMNVRRHYISTLSISRRLSTVLIETLSTNSYTTVESSHSQWETVRIFRSEHKREEEEREVEYWGKTVRQWTLTVISITWAMTRILENGLSQGHAVTVLHDKMKDEKESNWHHWHKWTHCMGQGKCNSWKKKPPFTFETVRKQVYRCHKFWRSDVIPSHGRCRKGKGRYIQNGRKQ